MHCISGQTADTKNTWTSKLIDPIAVDSTLVNSVDNVTLTSGFATNFKKQPKHVRQYATWSGYGDAIVMEEDTVYLHSDVYFNKAGQMTGLKTEDETHLFYYDKKGNIVYREIRPDPLDRYQDIFSRVEHISYDTHGNLLTYYEYEITKDFEYQFGEYKEYSYEKQRTDIIVTIKGIETRGRNYYSYTTTKKFDSSGLIQLKHNKGKVLRGTPLEYETEYSYETIKGTSYVKSIKYASSQPSSVKYAIDVFTRDASGRLLTKFDKNVKSAGYYGYKEVFEYPKKHTKVTKVFFETTLPKEQLDSFDEKPGYLKTFIKAYDSKGNIIKESESFLDNETTVTMTKLAEYRFDKHQNWTKKTVTDKTEYTPKFIDENRTDYDTESIVKFYREISYFSSPEKLAKPPKLDQKAEELKNEILLTYFK
ncbi:MAG: hypothetical protein AAF611_18400 [Bacteroidota bacterium]